MFDFRPIFPPYSIEKVNDALVVRQQQQLLEAEEEEEEEEMFEKKEENVSVSKTKAEREDDHNHDHDHNHDRDKTINEGRNSPAESTSSSSSSPSLAEEEEEEEAEEVTTKILTERNDSHPTDGAATSTGEEEIEMMDSSATSLLEKPREKDNENRRNMEGNEEGRREGMGAVGGDEEEEEAITATATATATVSTTNHSKASTLTTDGETDEEEKETIESGPEIALVQEEGGTGDEDDENTNTNTNMNANATIQTTKDDKLKRIDDNEPLPIVEENTKESTGETWSSHGNDEKKPMAMSVPIIHSDDASHDSVRDEHDENNVNYDTNEIDVDEQQQQQLEEQQQYEMLDELKTNEGDSGGKVGEGAAEPETLPATEGDGNGNGSMADGMQSSLSEAEHDSLSTDGSSNAESWNDNEEFGQTPQEQMGKEPKKSSLREERQQQQQLENDVPVTSSPSEGPLENDAATQAAFGDIHDNSKDNPNTDDSLDRVLSMLDNIQLPDTTIPPPPSSSSSSSSASGESSSTNANREFVTGLDELDKLFESVSPPDELDVGADGQSIQEVLTSQGIKIIAKRARGAWKNVRGWFENSVQGALPQWRVGGRGVREDGSKDDDDELEDIASLIQSGNGDVLLSKDWSLKGNDEHSWSGNNKVEKAGKDKSGKSVHSINDKTTRNGQEESESNESKPNGENNGGTKVQEKFPLLKTKQANKLWKFAKRKWKQAKHILDDLFSIFDLNDGDDAFDLSELNLDNIQSLIAKGGNGGIARGQKPMMKGEKPPNFDGKFGSAVDESFLKQRYEAMMKLQDSEK